MQAILQGKKRVLLTMATGTGKTVVAFQICWKLWSSKWNAKGDPTRKPRILYLADRNFLVDDPKDKTFSAFGDARHKIEGGLVVHSRELYFSTYQSIAKDENRPGLYKSFAPDFFDLIIVDECHRGSAKEDSNWREILEYFAPAYQLGMTATPLRDDNRDTYLYFGNPIYTYSLKQGIDDGFLAPYRVHRIVTQWDAAGWRPSKDDLDRYGREIPDEVYTTGDFERRVALRARTQAVARHLTDFLKKTDRFAKTIVFCVDQEHASEMRTALNNLNADPRPAISRLRLPRHRRRGRHRARPHAAVSGRGDAHAGHPHHLATAHHRPRRAHLPQRRARAPRQLDGRVQADHRARHARARRLRQALVQHPRLHRHGHAQLRRPGLRRRSRLRHAGGN